MLGGKIMYDVIVVGAGPAGISSSLYAKRANKNARNKQLEAGETTNKTMTSRH